MKSSRPLSSWRGVTSFTLPWTSSPWWCGTWRGSSHWGSWRAMMTKLKWSPRGGAWLSASSAAVPSEPVCGTWRRCSAQPHCLGVQMMVQMMQTHLQRVSWTTGYFSV